MRYFHCRSVIRVSESSICGYRLNKEHLVELHYFTVKSKHVGAHFTGFLFRMGEGHTVIKFP